MKMHVFGVLAAALVTLTFSNSIHAAERNDAAQKPPQAGMSSRAIKLRQPNVEIWLPPEFQSSEKKWPLIAFSHGFGGCARQSEFLTSYLADHGYIVVAPDHEDADCARQISGARRTQLQNMAGGRVVRPEKPFRDAQNWTDQTEKDRRDDILFAVASMLDDRQYKNYVDVDRMGLMGHSLGGYTALGLAGGWRGWKDARFKAVVALSPFVAPFLSRRTLSSIDVPIMYQGGTRDFNITPSIKRSGGAYTQSKSPKYFVELADGTHYAWTDIDKDHRDVISRTVLAFFDKYLKDQDVEIVTGREKQISLYWQDEVKK